MAQSKQGLYFKKDKKAQIYRGIEKGTTSSGFSAGTNYYPIAPAQIWCYSAQLSQSDAIYAAQYGEKETRFFAFNHYKGIKVYDMILYRGKWYRITRVDTTDDYNGEVFVYAQDAKGGWKPKEEELQPYTPEMWEK